MRRTQRALQDKKRIEALEAIAATWREHWDGVTILDDEPIKDTRDYVRKLDARIARTRHAIAKEGGKLP